MQRALRASRRVRIVRDHHDRLAVLAIERLQEIENLVSRLAIEVARRLVAEEQGRVRHDHPRDADTLLLAAGELSRHPGGKGANQAVGLAQLGMRPALAGVVGEDQVGQRLLTQAGQDRVDVSAVARRPGVRTALIVDIVDATGQTLLTVAGKIVSVEARHAAAIRDLLAPRTGAFAPQAFDEAFTPQQVLATAAPFIRNAVTATNVPTIS